MVSKLIKDIKTLFKSFTFFKTDDKTNYHNYINKHITYNNGELINATVYNVQNKGDDNLFYTYTGYYSGCVTGQKITYVLSNGETGEYIISNVPSSGIATIVINHGYNRTIIRSLTIEDYYDLDNNIISFGDVFTW